MSHCQHLWLEEYPDQGFTLPAGLRLKARFDQPPAGPGLLVQPAVAQWPALARANRRLLLQGKVSMAGLPLVQIRRCLREELAPLPVPVRLEEPLLLATGHQPVLYHPGVWVKLFAGSQAAEASGGQLVNVVVDSDTEDLAVPVPEVEPGSGRVRLARLVVQGTGPDHVPLERRPAPDRAAWRAFVEEARARVAPLLPEAAVRLERLSAVEPDAGESVARFFSRVRRAWEAGASQPGPTQYQELPVSRLSQTLAFRLWVMEWATQASQWREAYNEALRQYRELHKLRSRANPFPDLEATDEGVEIPFWCLVDEGGGWARRPVVVRRTGGSRLELRALTPSGTAETLIEVAADDPLEGARQLGRAQLPFRPKAIPMTLFVRLVVADLFIHGTGGARYETIGDFLMAARWPEAFGRAVPRYAVATATLPLAVPAAQEQAARLPLLEGLVRSLEHNPQRVVAALQEELREEAAQAGLTVDESLHALTAQKEALVQQIQAGGDKKALGQAIRAVNEELARRLEPARAYLVKELEAARLAQAVVTERGYPFFLYEPAQLWQLLAGEPTLEGG